MSVLAIVFLVLLGGVGLLWLSRHLMLSAEIRMNNTLTEDHPGPGENPPMISVLIAAKDEEAVIEQCVRTMLDQDYPNYEVILCNDRSDDRTAEIVAKIAEEDDRLTLVNITDLPEGWFGKPNAMQTGIKQAKGEYIAMIDADCRQTSRRTLSTAMKYALDHESDMLSVYPDLEMKGFWENVIQPMCSAIMVIWFNPNRINSAKPIWKKTAYANGAFMMIRKETYEAIGTHESVKTELNEDMKMAYLVKTGGHRLRVVRGNGLYKVRMYTSFTQMIRGWSRIFFGTFGTPARLFTTLAVVLLMSLMPWVMTGLGLGLGLTGCWNGGPVVGIVAAVVAGLQLSVICRYYKLIGAKVSLFWTYPISCAISVWCLLISISKLRPGAKVVWKSTAYAQPQGDTATDPPAS